MVSSFRSGMERLLLSRLSVERTSPMPPWRTMSAAFSADDAKMVSCISARDASCAACWSPSAADWRLLRS